MSKVTSSHATIAPRPIGHSQSSSSATSTPHAATPNPPLPPPPQIDRNTTPTIQPSTSSSVTPMILSTPQQVSGGNFPISGESMSLSTSQGNQSVMTEEEEDLEDYKPGGYHPVHIGDEFNDRYVVVRKLGWGHFSTVWLARDDQTRRHVALKVVKSDGHYTETALDEIQLLHKVVEANANHPGRRHTVQLLDDFRHIGPNGSHVCMVFEVLGENLLGLIKRYQHRGVPQHIVKQITKQVLLGLDYLHTECGIIHTDLKPENVLICIDDVEAVVAAELATCPAAVPTKIVGVPPSQGRGGTQTPRREGIFITGSQPLPSPSSSYGTSPMLDKYGFGMSKISTASSLAKSAGGTALMERAQTADSIGDGIGGVSLDKSTTTGKSNDPHFGEKTKAPVQPTAAGPSLLSQQLHHTPSSSNTTNTSGTSSTATTSASTSAAPSDTMLSTPATTPDSGPTHPELKFSTTTATTTTTTDPNSNTNGSATVHPAPSAGDPNELPPPFPYDPASLETIQVKIADLGNACYVDHHFTNDIQTRQYRCPEVILGAKWGPSCDMWSAACLFFELLTGDYLFDPQTSSRYSKDSDHLAQIIELVGEMPRHIALAGKYSSELFNKRGALREIQKLRMWNLEEVLQDKYLLVPEEAKSLASFMMPMLKYDINDRVTPKQVLEHPWLDGVLLQTDLDEMRAKHEEAVARSLGTSMMNQSYNKSFAKT